MYSRDKILKVMREIHTESQEISPYVVVAQPRRMRDEVPAQRFNGRHGLHTDFHGFSHGFIDVFGEAVDVARNYLIEQVLESDAKYMFFIGEDTVVPYKAFKKLHQTAQANPNAIITGVYYIKLSDAMIMVRKDNHIIVPNVDPGQLIEAWQTGMDCMLIPTEILRKMKQEEPELPFCCIANEIEGLPFIGEDNFFVHRLHKMGIKLLVDTDVQCLHMDLATGKYTAHPDVNLNDYLTNIPITEPLKWEDKEFIDRRWFDRLPHLQNKKDPIQSRIDAGEPVRLNMGCGHDKFEGWIGIDNQNDQADIKANLFDLDLPDNQIDIINASHVIEHVPYFKLEQLLTQWHASLKPGGKLIIETPDLEKLCGEFASANDQDRFMISLCIFGSDAHVAESSASKSSHVTSPHLWGYYPKLLTSVLNTIGYQDITVMPQQGAHPGHNFRVEAYKR